MAQSVRQPTTQKTVSQPLDFNFELDRDWAGTGQTAKVGVGAEIYIEEQLAEILLHLGGAV